jgi:hypothetical protein
MKFLIMFSCLALLCFVPIVHAEEPDETVEVIDMSEMTEPVELIKTEVEIEPVEPVKPGTTELPAETQDAPKPGAKGSSVLQVAIWPPRLQMFNEMYKIIGLRLGLPAAKNRYVYGLDIGGLATFTGDRDAKGEMKGIQFAPAGNDVEGDAGGLQIAGVINRVTGMVKGFQIAGFINEVQEESTAVQICGFCNFAHKTLTGIQIGAWNEQLEDSKGMQIGGINYTGSGFQIGVLNFNKRGIFPYMPGFNIGYKKPGSDKKLKHEPVTADQ